MSADWYPLRGEIFWIDWEPHRGSEQAGHRCGVVISGNAFNKAFSVCTVLAITTSIKPSRVAVLLPSAVTGKECQILPWQVMTVAQERLEDRAGILTLAQQLQVNNAMKLVWEL